jgi:hypothetical protein
MCHTSVQVAIFRPQARRLDFVLSMLPNYLGDRASIGADGCLALAVHVDSILSACSPASFVWSYPLEVYRARQTAAEMVGNLERAGVEVLSVNSAFGASDEPFAADAAPSETDAKISP